jgi:hypothetical protein
MDQLEKPVINMKCRRGSDKATTGQNCDGMLAEKLMEDGNRNAAFRCVKCKFRWNVPVGGVVNL